MRLSSALSSSAFLVLAVLSLSARAADDPALVHARELLARTILIDGHNDLPWAIRTDAKAPGDIVAYDLSKPTAGQTDLARLRAGGLGGQFWSVYIPGEGSGPYASTQLEQIELALRVIARYPDALQFASTAAEVRAAHKAHRIASLLGIEGGHAIENSLGALRAFHDLGVRYMTLTHNTHTDWADSAAETPARHHGLSSFGEEVVHEMNRLGVLVDLSHTSEETMDDALRVSRAPVIFSHSSARALCDVPRNVPDTILKRIPANGGVVMIAFVSMFVDQQVANVMLPKLMEFNLRAREVTDDESRKRLQDEIMGGLVLPKTSVGKVADHIEYVRKVAGVDNVGIGADFDGNTFWPEGLSDVSMYPNLFAELIRRGWSDADLEKLAGGNVLRAMERAEAVARELQKSTPASLAKYSAAADAQKR